jgi:hypothetical protein
MVHTDVYTYVGPTYYYTVDNYEHQALLVT